MTKNSKKPLTLEDTYPWILTVGGAFGLIASFALSLDKIRLLLNPASQLDCNLSPLISCGSVIKTSQASAFGFPNSFIGLMGFSVVVTIGMMLIASRHLQKMKPWFWMGLQFGTIFGVLFVHWLIFQSLYRIQALCPYCMLVWVVTITVFWYTTLHNLQLGVIKPPASLKGFVAFIRKHHGDILLLWFVVIAGLILNHFWYYWKTLL